MSLPLNQSSNFPNRVSSFRAGGNLYGNQPSNVSYGSLYDTGGQTFSRAPLPPPRNTSYPYSSYSSPYSNGYSSGYSPMYGRSMYNSYSPYYRQSYLNPLPGAPYHGDSFIEEAHESSRDAFASIESIVNSFGSINMMIESTYFALQSSFNAVLSVAENFSRLKSQFGQVLSAFTVIRTFQWLYRKFLYLIGLRKIDPTSETAWKTAARSLEDPLLGASNRKSSWPVFMFFVAVYAAPFLMWKFIKSIMQKGKPNDSWVRENGDYYYAVAKYRYDAQSPEELSFSAGEVLKLAPYEKQADKSWPLASNGKRTGIVPINYIDIKLKTNQPSSNARGASKNETKSPGVNSATGSDNSLRNNTHETSGHFKPPDISAPQIPLVHQTSQEAGSESSPPIESETATSKLSDSKGEVADDCNLQSKTSQPL